MNGDQNISTLGTTLEQTYSALEGKYEPQKIVELMTSVGFEGQDVVNFVNNKYEEERIRQLEELENQQKLMEEQRALYDSLKKKDGASELGGEPSGLPQDGSQKFDINPDTPSFMLSEEAQEQRKQEEQAKVQEQDAVGISDIDVPELVADPEKRFVQGEDRFNLAEFVRDTFVVSDDLEPNVTKFKQDLYENRSDLIKELDDQHQTAFDVVGINNSLTELRKISNEILSGDGVIGLLDPEFNKVTENLKHLQSKGLLTDIKIRDEFYGAVNFENIIESIDAALPENISNISGILDRANNFNESIGSEIRYKTDSDIDLNLYLQSAFDYRQAEEEDIENQVQRFLSTFSEEEIEDYNKGTALKVPFFGKIIADAADEFAISSVGIGQAFINTFRGLGGPFEAGGDVVSEMLGESFDRLERRKEERNRRQRELFNITDEFGALSMREKIIEGFVNDDISASEVFAGVYTDVQRDVGSAIKSIAEFYVGKGAPLVLDVAGSNYAYNEKYNPHISHTENTITSILKGGVEIAMNKALTKVGIGAEAAAGKIGSKIKGRFSKKSALDNAKKELKNSVKKVKNQNLIQGVAGEFVEEAIVELTGQVIDKSGDLITGRDARDINIYEIIDAGLSGAIGGAPIIGISNIGHSRRLKERQIYVEAIGRLKKEYREETNPKLKEVKKKELIKAMVDMQVISTEEQALYDTLSEEEQDIVLGLNQELSRIREIVARGKYWTGEKASKEEIKSLEKRFASILKQKKSIEDGAIKRAEDRASEKTEVAPDATNKEASAKTKTESKKDAAERAKTPAATEGEQLSLFDDISELESYDETKETEAAIGEDIKTREQIEAERKAKFDARAAEEQAEFDEKEANKAERKARKIYESAIKQIDAELAELEGDPTGVKNQAQIDRINELKAERKNLVEQRRFTPDPAPATEAVTEEVSSFDINSEDVGNIIEDTENVGDGKGKMKLSVAAAIQRFFTSDAVKKRVKKIKYFKSYKDMASYNPEVARMMKEAEKDGNVVAGYFDPATGTVLLNEFSDTSDIAEEVLSHGLLIDVIGKESSERTRLFNELKKLAKKNKKVAKLIKDVEDNPVYKKQGQEAIEEEAVGKFFRDYAANPAAFDSSVKRAIINLLNKISQAFGGPANAINSEDSLLQMARKYEAAYRGVETTVDVKQKAAEDITKDKTNEGRFSIKRKKEFTYLKDTELFYTDSEYRMSEFTGEFRLVSSKEKSVKVNDYFHYRNLWAKLTGNGKELGRMENVFFIKDGKRYNVKPPKPKTDRDGNIINMRTQPTIIQRVVQSRLREKELYTELRLQVISAENDMFDLWESSGLSSFTNASNFMPDIEEGSIKPTLERKLEAAVIAMKNIQALIDMGVTKEDLEPLRSSRLGVISKIDHPEFFNASGLKIFPDDTIDGAEPTTGRFSIKKRPVDTLTPAQEDAINSREGAMVVSIMAFEGKPALVIGYDSSTTDQSGVRTLEGTADVISHRNVFSAVTSESIISGLMSKEIEKNKMQEGDSGTVVVAFTTQGPKSLAGNPYIFDQEGKSLVETVTNLDQNTQSKVIESINKSLAIERGERTRITTTKKGEVTVKKLTLKSRAVRVLLASTAIRENENFRDRVIDQNKAYREGGRTSGVQLENIEDLKILMSALASKTVEGETDEVNDTSFQFRTEILNVILSEETRSILSDAGVTRYNQPVESMITEQYADKEIVNSKSGAIVAVKEVPFIVGKNRKPTKDSIVRYDRPNPNEAFSYKLSSRLIKEALSKKNKGETLDSFEQKAGLLLYVKEQALLEDAMTDVKKGKSGQVARAATKQAFETTLQITPEITSENKDTGRGSIRRDPRIKKVRTDVGEFNLKDMSRFQQIRNFFLRKFVRKYENIYRIQDEIRKGLDGSLPESQDFRMAETLMYGKAANALEKLEERVDAITALIKEKNLSIEEVENYMYALHAAERNAVIQDRDGKDEGSGMSNEEAKQILDEVEESGKTNDIQEVVSLIREIQQDTRDTMVKFGLESQETVDVFQNQFEFYVPLGGIATDQPDSAKNPYPTGGAGMHVEGQTFKRAEGRKTKAPNILAQIISQNSAVHIKARTNEALQPLYNLVKNNPVEDSKGRPVWYIVQKPKDKDPHVVGVRVDGVQKFIRFKDPSYAEALRGMGMQQTNTFVKMLRVPNSWLRASFTSLSPEFIITNFARDIQAAIINAAAETDREDSRINGEKIHKDLRKLVMPVLKSLGKQAIGKEDKMDPVIRRYYNEFKEDGGKTGWAYTKDLQRIAASLEADSKEKSKMQNVFGKLNNFKTAIENINDSVENSIRLAAYIAARQAGVSREKAAEFGKNVTVNFNQHGEWGQTLNGIYLFFNASIQATSVFARSMLFLKPKVDPEGYQRNFMQRVNGAQKMAFGFAVFGGMLTLLNRATSDEDEDGVLFYDKIPDYIKERNIIIMRPDGKNYFKIPLPYGYSLFHTVGVTATEYAGGGRTFAESTLFMAHSFINAFVPISFGQSKDLTTKTLKAALPTVTKPAMDIATNTTYFGSPVTGEQISFNEVPESSLSFRSPKAVQDFFKWMNEATGGSPVDSGSIDLNPDKAWYYLEYFLGGTGRFLQRGLITLPLKLKAKAEDNDYKFEANDIIFLRALYGEPSKFYDVNKYNENARKIQVLFKEIKDPSVRPSSPAEGRYKNVSTLEQVRKDIEKKLKMLRAAEREARKIEDFTERGVRIQEIRNKKNKLYMQFNKLYDQYRK